MRGTGMDQPAMGGIHAGSEVVRRGSRRGQESTSDGRNRCLKRSLTSFPNRWSGKRIRGSRRTTARPGWTVSRSGRSRPLGIPTVGDRVAQMVVKMHLEPLVEPHFHPDSYGYRPGRSALDAVATARERCWRSDWVIDLGIKVFFDDLDHELVMKAVRHHAEAPWVLLYVERWLRAPVQRQDGSQEERTKGSPQGAVVSPLLANLFLHYAFDLWMTRTYPDIRFE